MTGLHDHAAAAALGARLGPGAQVLLDRHDDRLHVAADWDACWVKGEPVRSLEDWRAIVAAGTQADVNGAFAVAWLDADGTLWLARDAIGERTLYYAQRDRAVVFASTLHAVLATGLVERSVNPAALGAYLAYAYVPGRETLAAGVNELLPGEMLGFRAGVVTRRRLWSLPSEDETREEADEAGMVGLLRTRLEDAVRRRLSGAAPVGAFLSGGIDSSLVVALARHLHDAPILTYSVSFGADYASELPWSSLVADHCHTDHRIVEIGPAAALHHLDDAIGLLSEPIGDPLTVPNALLFREAARDVGVVLNGEGGDPCFGGPKNLPMLLSELLGDGGNAGEPDRYPRERSYLRAHGKCYDNLEEMLLPEVRAALADDVLEAPLTGHLENPKWSSFVTRLMALNVTFKGAHHILPKVDAISAGLGVLARSPLFDRAIVETAFAIPPQLKLRGSVEKYVLKQAVRDLLPPAILERPKSGMLVPVEAWFRGPLLKHARERLLDGLAAYRLFDAKYLERLLAGRLGGLRPRRGAKIWLLVTLEAWLRTVLSDEERSR
ncbi:MAG: asparagine synthetase B family protein [Candidatus Rokuibacteriota bacterium]